MENKENKNLTNYGAIQKRVTKKVSPVFRMPSAKSTYDQLLSGKTSYLKFSRIENAAYDPRWITEIEDCLYDLGQIVKNPRSVTQTVTDVVPVELVRKTNAESVQHLATHSQYVKEIDEKGDVVPNKVLNIGSDDFIKTYENRFIATLIRKLVLFIEKRTNFIEENTKVKESEVLLYKNKSIVDGKEVEIETKIKVVSEADISSEEVARNESFARRVEEIRRYVLYYYNSEFMHALKTERNVRNPILMTNIIRKNKLYNHCYNLYKFLEKYELLGVEFKTNDKYANLSKDDLGEINNAMMVNFLALGGKDVIKNPKKKVEKTYSPKILTTIDDEQFVYGPWFKGPFEFARIDQSYIDHLEATKFDLPAHMTKMERNYYKEEIERNKEIAQEVKSLKKIAKRKNKEGKAEDKYFNEVVRQRNIENEQIKKEKEAIKIQESLNDIERARRALMFEEAVEEAKKEEILEQQEEQIIEKPKPKKPVTKRKPRKVEPIPQAELELPKEPEVTVEPQPVKPIKEELIVEQKAEEPVETPIEKIPEKAVAIKPVIKETAPKPKEKEPTIQPEKVVKKATATKKEEKKAEPVTKETKREKIPGRFIVKLLDGYYVNEKTLSINKDDAMIFDDFNLANDIKKAKGGKVVKI